MSMTSSSSRRRTRHERRSPATRLLALLAVGVVVAAGFASGLATTAATLTSADDVATTITTRPACVQDPKNLSAYTSGLLDAGAPVLRWSFSDGLLPKEATSTPDPASDPTTPAPKASVGGLLVCDPAELARVGTAGSLALTQGGAGSGLTASAPPLGGSFTLLFWAAAEGAEGELASLTGPAGDLVLTVTKGTVHLTAPDGATVSSPDGSLAGGRTHLVAVVFTAKTVFLTVDGASSARVDTTWTPGIDPNVSTLTIGARLKSTSAGALIDEVALLGTAYDPEQFAALEAADRWWAPGPVPAP